MQQPIIFGPQVTKGNSKGTGWITVPMRLRDTLKIGDWYELALVTQEQHLLSLHLRLVKNKSIWGFYLPQALCLEKQLIGKQVNVELKHTEYVPVTFSEITRVRIPNIIAERYNIQKDELYNIAIKTDQQEFQEIVIINTIDRHTRNSADEQYFIIRMHELQGSTSGSMKIISKIEKMSLQESVTMKETIYIPNLFPEAVIGKIDSNKMIIFSGNHRPIITPINVNVVDIVHYFGCYYADGTKIGSWSINGSTPEQVQYYMKVFSKLIINSDLDFRLVYTTSNFLDNANNIKLYLQNKWQELANININLNNIYFHESTFNNKIKAHPPTKHNSLGSVRLIDNRSLVLELHKKVLDGIEAFLLNSKDVKLSWQFLFGILEGDGSVGGGKSRCRITFTCRDTDRTIPILLTNVGISNLKPNHKSESSPNTVDYSFGLISILQNIDTIQNHLFKFYPKRRKLFLQKLFRLPSIQFILGEIDSLFPLAYHPLKINNLIGNKELLFKLNELKKEYLRKEANTFFL